jgi:hypothetical protein
MKTSVLAHITSVQWHEQVSSGARRAKSQLYTKINRFTFTIFQEVINSWQAITLNVRFIGKCFMYDVCHVTNQINIV